jgi:UDP-xylose/UDP-N-acetylglucosamine transporter B4
MVILRKRYPLSKYLSVLLITVGIAVCTIVSGSDIVSIFTVGTTSSYTVSCGPLDHIYT